MQARDAENHFQPYQDLLIRFGLDANLLNKLEDAKKAKLLALFADLKYLVEVIGEKESIYALMNWADVFFAEQGFNVEEFFTAAHRRANDAAKKADSTMTMVYLGLNALGFILSVLALPSVNVDAGAIAVDPAATSIGSGWNYIDTCGGIVLGIKQIQQGEVGMGMVNLAGSLQLAGCTIAADLGKWCHGVHMASATMSGLTGFSFAACMFISGALEFYEVYKADERIKVLEAEMNTERGLQKQSQLQKAIYIESAQRENHLRSAKSWMACGVAMTLIAVAGYVALSGLTFGALPIATAVFAGAAFITGLIRKWWVGRVDHVANVKDAFLKKKSGDGEKSLAERLQKCLDADSGMVNGRLTVPGLSIFGDVEIKFQDYLKNMLVKNPKKLEAMLDLYEKAESEARYTGLTNMLNALKQHRNYKIFGGFGKTTGEKIYAALMAPPSAPASPVM